MSTADAELCFSSANCLSNLLRQKKISCTELMQTYLRRIADVNPTVNAIVQPLAPEAALEEAKHADKQLAIDATAVGPLHGLPITVKDSCKVKGLMVSKGSLGYHMVSDEDASLVARLRAAGAIVVGVTNVPELHLAYETDNDRYGKTLNPYHLEHTPGGSSGGEAAIIAVGGSVLGLGSDMLGSIRQPAHNTGIVGLKPTRGLLPNTGHVPDDGCGPEGLLLSYGPMARFVDDLILALPLLASLDMDDTDTLSSPPTRPIDADAQLTSLRIAFYVDNGVVKPDEATLQTIQNTMRMLQAEVHQIVEHCPTQLAELYMLITEVFALKGDRGLALQTLLKDLGVKRPSTLVQAFLAAARGCTFSVSERQKRLHRMDQLRTELERFFMPYDAIICPVAATPAKRHGRSSSECHDFSYLSVYNLMGWPALSVRCGTSAEGLPIGLQIITKPWQDMTALSIGKKLETLLGGWQPPPLFS